MKKVKINGFAPKNVELFLKFMESKLSDKKYIYDIEMGGNECEMNWLEDDMDISGEDMVHSLFDLYGEEREDQKEGCIYYTLKISEIVFETYKEGCEWGDEYWIN